MMREVLERRLKHSEWPAPSLLVIDGGKGQVSSVKETLTELKLNIPLIGLAKREETIITSDFKEIRLPKNSKALHLIMRLRDEAHRFAITYHKKLRSKFIFS
jgi:excinuclease ABC subunit C